MSLRRIFLTEFCRSPRSSASRSVLDESPRSPSRVENSTSYQKSLLFCSEMTPEGRRETKLDQILLNGNNIALLVPGGMPDEAA